MEPLAIAMICDEIRLEANGKPFIIGVYQQQIIFPALPATVPQLIVVTTLFSDIRNPITQYTVNITGPGINLSHEVGPVELPPNPFSDATRAEISGIIPIRPFAVTEPGVLDIIVKFAGGETRARRTLIVSAATQEVGSAEQNETKILH